MVEPITMPPALMAQGLSFRSQGAGDIPFIRDLYISHRWDEMQAAEGWTDEQRLIFLQDQFRLQHMHYTENYTDSDFLIIEQNGKPIGRLYLFRHNIEELRIVEIGLMPDWRGQGLGTALLTMVQNMVRQSGYACCSIHVEATNPARHLYQRLGFVDIKPVGPYFLMAWSAEDQAKTA